LAFTFVNTQKWFSYIFVEIPFSIEVLPQSSQFFILRDFTNVRDWEQTSTLLPS
jgi:hypothetical protein